MKKVYSPTEMEIVEFEAEDVILTSQSRVIWEYGDEDDVEESENDTY